MFLWLVFFLLLFSQLTIRFEKIPDVSFDPDRCFRLLQAFLLISLHKSIYKNKITINISDPRLKLFVPPIRNAVMTTNYKAPCC